MLTKRIEKELDGNWTRMLQHKTWLQHPTKQQLYGHLPPISKTIKIRWTRHAGHSWKSQGELISNILLWTHSHGQAGVGRPARNYLQQLCADTGCSLESLLNAMDDRDEWRRRVREIHACDLPWYWWYIYIYFLGSPCDIVELVFQSYYYVCLGT